MAAVASAPSARSLRRTFGIRKATKNASVAGPAPNARATTMSRTKPSTRLASVAEPIEPSARTTCPSTPPRGSFTLKARRDSGMMHDGPTHESDHEGAPGGEYEVGIEADATERDAAGPQPRGALARP